MLFKSLKELNLHTRFWRNREHVYVSIKVRSDIEYNVFENMFFNSCFNIDFYGGISVHWISAKSKLKCDYNICLRLVVEKYFYSTAFEVNYSGFLFRLFSFDTRFEYTNKYKNMEKVKFIIFCVRAKLVQPNFSDGTLLKLVCTFGKINFRLYLLSQ